MHGPMHMGEPEKGVVLKTSILDVDNMQRCRICSRIVPSVECVVAMPSKSSAMRFDNVNCAFYFGTSEHA